MEERKRKDETAGTAGREMPAGNRESGDKAAAVPCKPMGAHSGMAEVQGRRMERGAVAPGSAWALVTGAGSGIGRCYALRLAALGYRLVIAGNNRAPLEAVAEEIRQTTGGKPTANRVTGTDSTATQNTGADGSGALEAGTSNATIAKAGTGATSAQEAGNSIAAAGHPGAEQDSGITACTPAAATEVRIIATDLARVGAAQELYDRIAAEGIGIDVVINNAGIFSFCDILATPAERIERIILLHDLTVTQLCRLFAADMVRRGVRGHILNMSSYSLWMPFPGLALYSASKAYMRSFSVAFAKEVRERGIRVTAVCPAGVATNLYGLTPHWQRIGRKLGVLITPDSCARRGLKALWRGRRCIVPDWWNRAWIPFCKVLPMWVLRPVRRFTMKFQK